MELEDKSSTESKLFSFDGRVGQVQKLDPTIIYVLSILGLVISVCFAPIGFAMTVIGVILAYKKIKMYQANPKAYYGYDNFKVAQIITYVALGLSFISLLLAILRYTFLAMHIFGNT